MTLRNQVALYNNKYEEFEKSLTRSNKMFGGFKEEMESVSIIKSIHVGYSFSDSHETGMKLRQIGIKYDHLNWLRKLGSNRN